MDLTQINLPLSLEDFKILKESLWNGAIEWKDLPSNLRIDYNRFKSENDKPMIEELTKKGIIGRYD